MKQFALVLSLSIVVLGCQEAPEVATDAGAQLHVNNGTPLELILDVNGRTST